MHGNILQGETFVFVSKVCYLGFENYQLSIFISISYLPLKSSRDVFFRLVKQLANEVSNSIPGVDASEYRFYWAHFHCLDHTIEFKIRGQHYCNTILPSPNKLKN